MSEVVEFSKSYSSSGYSGQFITYTAIESLILLILTVTTSGILKAIFGLMEVYIIAQTVLYK